MGGAGKVEHPLAGGRLDQLDGLRGIAAVIVVLFHFLSATAPALVPEQGANAWIAYSPIAVLWNGNLAVAVFFVLSGFVITDATLRRGAPLWADTAVRYLRIGIPSGCSALFAWALLSAFPSAATELSERINSKWLDWTYQRDIPNPAAAAYEGMITVFWTGGSFFNNALWTMRPELIGSVVCFIICTLRRGHLRMIAASVFSLFFVISQSFGYQSFIFGMVLREAWGAGWLSKSFPSLGVVLGFALGTPAVAELLANSPGEGSGALNSVLSGLLYPVAATLIVYGVVRSSFLSDVLSNRAARFLGMISFPLYLIHVPIIYTVFAAAWLQFDGSAELQALSTAAIVASMFALAYVVHRVLERPFLMHLKRMRERLQTVRARSA